MKILLSNHNIELLARIATFQILTTKQIAFHLYEKNFSSMEEKKIVSHNKSVSNTLRKLELAGYISRNWIPTLSTREKPEYHPHSAWFFTRKNFVTIKKEIQKSGRATMWELFEDIFEQAKTTDRYAQNTLRHEVGISATYLALEKAIKNNAEISLPFFLRTSPRHKDVSSTVIVKLTKKDTNREIQKKFPFNPDGVFALRDNNGVTFYMVEYDNNTETTKEKLTNKFIAYEGYRTQKRFGEKLAPWLNQYFGLELSATENAGFRVLFVTTTPKRRNDLFAKSRMLPTSAFFYFTTLDDFEKNPLGNVWYRKREFEPFNEQMRNLASASPSIRRKFLTSSVSAMQTVSIP